MTNKRMWTIIPTMNFRTLVIAIIFLSIFAMGLQFSMDTDSWWHLRTGELIVEQGAVPTTDSFSYTRSAEPWHYPSNAWLSELQLFFIYDNFGPGGLNLWVAALVTLAFMFIFLSMSGSPLLKAFVLVLAVTVSGVYWASRPYMLSFVLAAAFLWILEDHRWGRKNRLIWLPLLMILWVNSHPGYAIGFLLLGVYLFDAGARWVAARFWGSRKKLSTVQYNLKPLAIATLGAAIAATVNPAGLAVFTFPFETLSIGVLQDAISEWQSPNFHSLPMQPFAWLLLMLLGVLGAARRPLALIDFLLVAGFAYMGLLAARNIPLFALVAPVVLTRHAEPWLQELRQTLRLKPPRTLKMAKWQPWLNTAFIAVVTLFVLARAAMVYTQDANDQVLATRAPVTAVSYIQREQPPGRLFNSYNWGGYLVWALRNYPVYIDGRTDLYADELLAEWLDTISAKAGWQDTLDKWDVRLVLIEPNWPLAQLLVTEGWQLLYEDEQAVLYGR
ncbi:MAG: hypothetical protein WD740_06830 [Anaerolineales bacterium]